jgi:tellurite resistance-related uncharacterized protein
MDNICNNVIILGDFNTNCNNKHAFGKLYKKGYTPALRYIQNTNIIDSEQYDNIWYHPKSFAMIQPGEVHREQVQNISDHCLILVQFYVRGKCSPKADEFNPPDLTRALAKKNKLTLGKIFCCGGTQIVCHCEERE